MGPARNRGGSGGHGPAILDSKLWPSVKMHCKSEQHGAGPGIGVEVVTGEEFLSRSRGKAKAGESMGEMAINRSSTVLTRHLSGRGSGGHYVEWQPVYWPPVVWPPC